MQFSRFIQMLVRLAEAHPYTWKIAWEAVHRLPFLLPHDKSYNALRHFIAAAPDGLFLDVGANDGISAMSFRRFDARYRILSLEPNKLLEERLKKLRSTDPRFEYRMVGAGAAPARIPLFVPFYKGIALHTFTSGSRDQVTRALEECFGQPVASRANIDTVEGEIVRLDDLQLQPTIVKIDAEGFDYDVLLGMTETIALSRPFIIIEISVDRFDPIVAFMRERKYELLVYDIGKDCFSPNFGRPHASVPGQRNFFAVPRESVKAVPILNGNLE